MCLHDDKAESSSGWCSPRYRRRDGPVMRRAATPRAHGYQNVPWRLVPVTAESNKPGLFLSVAGLASVLCALRVGGVCVGRT